MKAKKKPRRRSDSSGGYTLSDIIQSPPAAGTYCIYNTDRVHRFEMFSHQTQSLHITHTYHESSKASLLYLTTALSVLSVVSPFLVKSVKVNSTESLQELLTSDSEGSNMGVGSPRDMQSPVFHDRTEVDISKTKLQAQILLHT